MEQGIAALAIICGVLAYMEILKLKERVESQQKQLNELCKLTGNKQLSTYFVSDDVKEKVLHLKNIGKETEAVKEIRLATSMDLLEAKQYVDKL